VETTQPTDDIDAEKSDAENPEVKLNTALSSEPGNSPERHQSDSTLASRVKDRVLKRWVGLVDVIAQHEPPLKKLNDRELRKASLALRYRAKAGEPLADLLAEAYALVREASVRATGMRHFDVQMLGGAALFHDSVAEMETGEGKTLTATLPMYLRALSGKGAQLATVNDYLATRDAKSMMPIYKMLGMTVGIVETDMDRPARYKAYHCDITYGTAKEFGFDLLRDRLLIRQMGAESLGVPGIQGNSATSRYSGILISRSSTKPIVFSSTKPAHR